MTVSLPSSPSSGLSSCQFMIIRVVVGGSGSGTYSVIGDCVVLQTTGNGPQSSGGQRSPRRKSTSSTALMGRDRMPRSSGGLIGLLHERSGERRRVGPQIVDGTQMDGVVAVVEMGLERRVTLRRL